MNEIDRIYTKTPFYGARRITWQLHQNGILVNHKRVERLMGIMGIQAISPKPFTSKPDEEHETFPYLLKGVEIFKPNQVWGTDITYIRIHQAWVYLVAMIDWYSRYVLSWELSPHLTADFCISCLTEALAKAVPGIHNSDKGSQFTSKEYLGVLKSHPSILISMDGRGRCMDNIFTERLWRNVKYEEVYLKDYANISEARENLAKYFQFYNWERPFQSLGNQIPGIIYNSENSKLITKIK